MVLLNLNYEIEEELNALANVKNSTIERLITEAVDYYLAQQEDLNDLRLLHETRGEPTISFANYLKDAN